MFLFSCCYCSWTKIRLSVEQERLTIDRLFSYRCCDYDALFRNHNYQEVNTCTKYFILHLFIWILFLFLLIELSLALHTSLNYYHKFQKYYSLWESLVSGAKYKMSQSNRIPIGVDHLCRTIRNTSTNHTILIKIKCSISPNWLTWFISVKFVVTI